LPFLRHVLLCTIHYTIHCTFRGSLALHTRMHTLKDLYLACSPPMKHLAYQHAVVVAKVRANGT
jgi:hypothetical protein